jgi:hypothetical protein
MAAIHSDGFRTRRVPGLYEDEPREDARSGDDVAPRAGRIRFVQKWGMVRPGTPGIGFPTAVVFDSDSRWHRPHCLGEKAVTASCPILMRHSRKDRPRFWRAS